MVALHSLVRASAKSHTLLSYHLSGHVAICSPTAERRRPADARHLLFLFSFQGPWHSLFMRGLGRLDQYEYTTALEPRLRKGAPRAGLSRPVRLGGILLGFPDCDAREQSPAGTGLDGMDRDHVSGLWS